MRAYADVSVDEFVSTADGQRFFKNPGAHSSEFVPVDEIQLIPEGIVRNFCSANGEETKDFCLQVTFLGRPPELTLQLLLFGDDVNLRGKLLTCLFYPKSHRLRRSQEASVSCDV